MVPCTLVSFPALHSADQMFVVQEVLTTRTPSSKVQERLELEEAKALYYLHNWFPGYNVGAGGRCLDQGAQSGEKQVRHPVRNEVDHG